MFYQNNSSKLYKCYVFRLLGKKISFVRQPASSSDNAIFEQNSWVFVSPFECAAYFIFRKKQYSVGVYNE
jgi:hypothetical protein